MESNTHEVTVLAGAIDISWRAHQEHIFYLAEETLAGTIILTPAAGVPARRKISLPPREQGMTGEDYLNVQRKENGL